MSQWFSFIGMKDFPRGKKKCPRINSRKVRTEWRPPFPKSISQRGTDRLVFLLLFRTPYVLWIWVDHLPLLTSVSPSVKWRQLDFNISQRLFCEMLSLRNTQKEVCAQITLKNAASCAHLLHIHKVQQHINLSPSINHLFNFNTVSPTYVTKGLSFLLSAMEHVLTWGTSG